MKPLGQGPVDLEEAFFAREHARLLEDMRLRSAETERRELLRNVVQIKDDAFLDRLLALGIGPETALALRLVPLVFVAWADGSVSDPEREAILKAATDSGLAAEDTARTMLESWLAQRPDAKLLELWKAYVEHAWGHFTADERSQMRQSLLGSAQAVAEAAGGFLGLTSKVSATERELLEELEAVLS